MRIPMLFLAIAIGLRLSSPEAEARNKKTKSPPPEPQDAIEVVGHIPLTETAVTGFLSTQHYSNYYLYAEHGSGKDVTLIDVTKANRPAVLADVAYPSGTGAPAVLFAVAGTAAIIAEQQGAPATSPAAQTIRIMDFSDPQHPKVAREFAGVTAMSRDDGRGLIFLANPEGVWILRQSVAEDPELEKEYARHVLYDH